ncbi:MAG: hypothetical protein J1E97_06620 [Muribaculaceae bacterium]|nr:hypothetical protein [Muribaculaceae bacterium]
MKNRYLSLLSLVLLLAATSCESIMEDADFQNDGRVSFMATVSETRGIKPTFGTRTPDDNTLQYVTYKDYDTDFYIKLDTEIEGSPVTKYGAYIPASTYEGKLDPISQSTALGWMSMRGDHTFTGWTFPATNANGYSQQNPFATPGSAEYQKALTDGVEISFKNSSEDEFGTVKNNAVYEKFIGTKSGEVSYIEDGTYVPLKFRHLVSKIFVDELILIWNGSVQEHLKANMTIYGLPTTATFYPDPSMAGAAADNPNNLDEWPTVIPIHREDDEMTFYIGNEAGMNDYAWICPEVDFRDLSFSISLLNTENEFAEMKEYNGTFEDVVFDRSQMNWDNADGGDDTVLHAGEMMALKIILYPGGGGGMMITILPWSTHDPEDTPHYSHAGLYSDNTLDEVVKAGSNQQMAEELFDLYGSDENGEKVFNLYENATTTGKELVMADDYYLDGNNHLITVPAFPIKVKNVRNVFLTDGKGHYVYINADGEIFSVDPKTFQFGQKMGQLTPNATTSVNFE